MNSGGRGADAADFIVIMGVAGSGKTTVGRLLAKRLGWRFIEGDDFHGQENVGKMSQGIPLSDEDRSSWLERLRRAIQDGGPVVVACSALKKRYREILSNGHTGIRFVFLNGDYDLIRSRLEARKSHFMTARMLDSQFADLEIPLLDEAVHVDAALSPEEIVPALLLLTVSQPGDSDFTDSPVQTR